MRKGLIIILSIFFVLVLSGITYATCSTADDWVINVKNPLGVLLPSNPYSCTDIVDYTVANNQNCPSTSSCTFGFAMPANCGMRGMYKMDCTNSVLCGADVDLFNCAYDDCSNCCTSGTSYVWLGDGNSHNCCGDNDEPDYWTANADTNSWCSGGFTACVSNTYYNNGDSNSYVCACGGASWNIGGEVSATTCCGDDAGEVYETRDEYQNTGWWNLASINDLASDNACCSAINCVYNSVCHNYKGVQTGVGAGDDNRMVCHSDGRWLDCDGDANRCGQCFGDEGVNSRFIISGDGAIGEYGSTTDGGNGVTECCGDDVGEYVRYYDAYNNQPNGVPPYGTDDTADKACCSASTDCVYDGDCYSAGYYDLNGNGRTDVRCYTDGRWLDVDYHTAYCTAQGYNWNVGGGDADVYTDYYTSTATRPDRCYAVSASLDPSIDCCCGDDAGENYRYYMTNYDADAGTDITDEDRMGSTNTGDKACCDDDDDCVYQGTCYTEGSFIDLNSNGVDDGWCMTSDSYKGYWRDVDDSSTSCATANGVWLMAAESAGFGEYDSGSATECCGDDLGEYITTQGVGATRCCNNANDCVDSSNSCVSSVAETIANANCLDSNDNDCDGECDYDSTFCSKGDSGCPVSVTNIAVSDSSPWDNSAITVDCTSSVAGANSVEASVDGVGACSFTGWAGNVASFSCNVGSANCPASATKTARCGIDTTKSYQSGADQTTNIDVQCSDCSIRGTQVTCESVPSCEWCPECGGAGNRLTNGGDVCVNTGNCPAYACSLGVCGAVCDGDVGGCGAATCNTATCLCNPDVSCNPDEYGSAACCDDSLGLEPDIDTDNVKGDFVMNCVGASCYGISFPLTEVVSVYDTFCCGDDSGEVYETRDEYANTGQWNLASINDLLSDNACCSATNCVYNSVCYNYKGVQTGVGVGDDNRMVCHSDGRWLDCDGDANRCGQCFGDEGVNSRFTISGDGVIGEYGSTTDGGGGVTECCGDDAGENYEVCEKVANIAWACDGTDACCDQIDCVYDSSCYSDGECSQLQSSGNDQYGSCISGTWRDSDVALERCTACGLDWATEGEGEAFGEYTIGQTECCGDDSGEFFNYFNLHMDSCDDITDEECIGNTDDPLDSACCNNAADCVYNGQCYSAGYGPIDLDGDGVQGEYCSNSGLGTWFDCDVSEGSCESPSCSNRNWTNANWETPFGEYENKVDVECCGDDFGEFIRYRQVKTITDGNGSINVLTDPTDITCCPSPDACVFNGVCYMDLDVAVGEINDSCAYLTESACGTTENCQWHIDCIGTNSMCKTYDDIDRMTGQDNMTMCDGINNCQKLEECRVMEWEFSEVPKIYGGTYQDKVFKDINQDNRLEVCDPGEWIDPNTDPDLCEAMGGFWLGTACCGDIDPDPDCDGIFYGNVKDVDGVNVGNAEINLIGTSYMFSGGSLNYSTTTDAFGDYNVDVTGNGTYDLIASKSNFNPKTVINQFVGMSLSKEVNFTLVSLYEQCEADCTYVDDEVCHAACDGRVNCSFYTTETKNVCNGVMLGWSVLYNVSHEVICCEGQPYKNQELRVISVNLDDEVETMIRLVRLVVLRGKPTRLIIDAFN